MLGDLGKGNGDPADTSYGATVTPNEHAWPTTSPTFDNFYDSGMLSADGHNWLVQADNNDYLAQDAASAWARSYPYPGGDAAVLPAGRLHLEHRRDRGQAPCRTTASSRRPRHRHAGHLAAVLRRLRRSWRARQPAPSRSRRTSSSGSSDVPSLNEISNHELPAVRPDIPDQYRADIWEQDFKQAEQTGDLPNLTIMTLATTTPVARRPAAAQVADNDLAVGRIVSDDLAQPVLEGLGGLRARGRHPGRLRPRRRPPRPAVDRQPVRQARRGQQRVLHADQRGEDDRADPRRPADEPDGPGRRADVRRVHQHPGPHAVRRCAEPDPAHPGCHAALIPLTPTATTAADPVGRRRGERATSGPAAPRGSGRASRSVAGRAGPPGTRPRPQPKLTGPNAAPDSVNPAQMNRYDWYTSTGWTKPYPGDKRDPGARPGARPQPAERPPRRLIHADDSSDVVPAGPFRVPAGTTRS